MLTVTGRLRDGFSFYRWESWGSEMGLAYQRWGLLFCKHLLLIEGQLLYNIVLVSAIHQHESAVGTHMCSLPLEPPSTMFTFQKDLKVSNNKAEKKCKNHSVLCNNLYEKRNKKKNRYMYTYGLPRWLSDKESTCNGGTWARSLGREDPLEEKLAARSSILPRISIWTEEPWGGVL